MSTQHSSSDPLVEVERLGVRIAERLQLQVDRFLPGSSSVIEQDYGCVGATGFGYAFEGNVKEEVHRRIALHVLQQQARSFSRSDDIAFTTVESRTQIIGVLRAWRCELQEAGRLVYHGSNQPWTKMRTLEERLAKFDVDTRGLPDKYVQLEREILERAAGAVWFTDSQYVANEYADCDKPDKVVEAFISLQNPLDMRELELPEIERLLSEAHGCEQKISTEYGYAKGVAHAIVRDNTRLIQWAKAHGYDGIIHPDTDIRGSGVHTSYVAFSPGQVMTMAEILGTGVVVEPDPELDLDEELDVDRVAMRF